MQTSGTLSAVASVRISHSWTGRGGQSWPPSGGVLMPRFARNVAAPLVVALSFLAVVVTVTPAGAQAPRHGGELVFVVPSSPPSYDAHREETFGTIHPIAPHYNTL